MNLASDARSGRFSGRGHDHDCEPAPLLFRWIERRLSAGSLTVCWPDGRTSQVAAKAPGPVVEIQIRRWRAVRRAVLGGALGFAESYFDGDWDSPDLAGAVEFAAVNRRNASEAAHPASALRFVNRLRHRLNANTLRGSRRNIAFHYDLGNDFYAEWLDPGMTYSSAIFEDGANSLEAAQSAKYRRLMGLIDPKPGQHILELGCGWGNFATLAAHEYGVRVTAITLSKEQQEMAQRRIYEQGLSERVTIRLADYRSVRGQYDHVASIEMFEAVGEKYWPEFFAVIRRSLRSGGRAALQIITIDDVLFEPYRRGVDFVQRHVFPGGMLPSVSALRHQVSGAGLCWSWDASYGRHYARTLAEWRERFEDAWPRLGEIGFDNRFRRMWMLYLAYCEGGFRAGNIDVRQLQLTRS